MDITFNVIFVPGTVPYLLLPVQSLVDNSRYCYRLISNGLNDEEVNLLKRYADSHEQLSFFVYPAKNPLEHGTILDLLYYRFRDEVFAFCDPDIVALKPFGPWVDQQFQGVDALSSCSAVMWEDFPRREGFAGRATHTRTGERLPTSFFTLYRREAIAPSIEMGMSLTRRLTCTQFSNAELNLVKSFGWQNNEPCDTGKVVNLDMMRRHCKIRHVESERLLHLGGVASWLMKNQPSQTEQVGFELTDQQFRLRETHLMGTSAFCRTDVDLMFRQYRELRSKWFAHYIRYLFGAGAEPTLSLENSSWRDRFLKAKASIDYVWSTQSLLKCV